MEALKAKNQARFEAEGAGDRTAMTETTEFETTYAANTTTNISGQSGKVGAAPKKKSGKPKMSAKEKKERSVCAPLLDVHYQFIASHRSR